MSWQVEEGIGEHRAIRVADGEIVAAKIAWPGELPAGAIVEGRLASRRAGSSRGTAELPGGTQVLVDKLPREASEGAPIVIEVTRAAIGEGARLKRAQGRPTDARPRTAPTLADSLNAMGEDVCVVPRFSVSGWDELWGEAADGRITFAGGEVLFSPTPAMTLIDVDGDLAPAALALASVPAIASGLRRFDIGGSIGIDFPTLEEKAARRTVAERLDDALADWPHERTAMNGFGFVQIVARLTGPSILHRIARDPVGAAARQLLRRAEGVRDPGVLLLTCHPAVEARIEAAWRDALARRSGRQLRIVADPALAPTAGFAQSVAS